MLPPTRNPFFLKQNEVPWFTRYIMFPIMLVLSVVLVPLRLFLIVTTSYVFGFMCYLVDLGSHYPEPTGPIRTKLMIIVTKMWTHVFLFLCGIIVVEKNKRPDSKVMVQNHSCMLDPFVGLSKSPGICVSKHQIAKIWFMRMYFKLTRSFLVQRDGTVGNSYKSMIQKSITEQMKVAVQNLHGQRLTIFPEGTIPASGYLMRFKSSAFRLGVPVTPVCIKYKSIFKPNWAFRSTSLAAMFFILGNPMGIAEFHYLEPQSIQNGEDPQEFADRVGKLMAQDLGYEYTSYQNQDWVYFGLGKTEKPCTEVWQKDFGWMGTLGEFCKKHHLSKQFRA